LVDLHTATGERVLVLRIDVIDKYAASLVLMAKSHPRKVPVLEYRNLGLVNEFPGLLESERLNASEEQIVLATIVELFLARGLAFEHANLLVFPSEFPRDQPPDLVAIAPEPTPLYYKFDGPIDNIWASLVANLAVTAKFGSVRLWAGRAEYEEREHGVFGACLREVHQGSGRLELYFSREAAAPQRSLFIKYVVEHLRRNGVSVTEGMGIRCKCGKYLDEALFRWAMERGDSKLKCSMCPAEYPVTGGETAAMREYPGTELDSNNLDANAAAKRKIAADRGKSTLAKEMRQKPGAAEPIKILHLSDFHFAGDERLTWELLRPLARDLQEALDTKRLDYLVVSGDFADRCQDRGFDAAEDFLKELVQTFALSADRLVLCPGNHDLNLELNVYRHHSKYPRGISEAEIVKLREGCLIRDAHAYPRRFDRFRKMYHNLLQQPYPLPLSEQAVTFWYEQDGIEFLTVNTAWEIDSWFRQRIGVNLGAVGSALGQRSKHAAGLRILVGHHQARGQNGLNDTTLFSSLADEGFRLYLHGDIHEPAADAYVPLTAGMDMRRALFALGTGSLGQGGQRVPRLYNLLEVDKNFKSLRVRMRAQYEAGGVFMPHAVVRGRTGPSGDFPIRL